MNRITLRPYVTRRSWEYYLGSKSPAGLAVPVLNEPLAAEVIAAVNAERAAHQLGKVRRRTKLMNCAQHHADNMARFDKLEHVLWEADLPHLMHRLQHYRYRWVRAGENGAAGFTTAAGVVKGWMGSPPHRATILRGALNDVGVGMALNAKGVKWWCLVLGKKAV